MSSRIGPPGPFALADAAVFSASDIEAYEREILANPQATEHDASRFFHQFPKFLCLGTGAEVRREVVLLGTNQRVDFFRRPYGGSFWDIIELKGPHKPLVSGIQTLHPHLSAEVRNAIDQALDYGRLIDKDDCIRLDLKKKGIAVSYPQIIVVVGQNRGEIDAETLRMLYDRARRLGAVDPRSYTDIYAFAKEHYARSKIIILPAMYIAEPQRPSSEIDIEHLARRLAHNPTLVHNLQPRDFEHLVAFLFKSYGYTVSLTPASHIGRDVIATYDHDGIGKLSFLIECKRYAPDRPIGIDAVRSLHGAVVRSGATKGVLVTTSGFSKAAAEFLGRQQNSLNGVDFECLITWLRRHRR